MPSQAIRAAPRRGQWVGLGGSAFVAGVLRRGRDAMLEPSRDRALELFHPDLVSVDHRQIGLGVRDLDGWLGSMDVLGPGTSVIGREIFDVGPSGVLGRTSMTAPDGESTWEFLQLLVRVGPDDDRIIRQEIFDLDQIDDARARFAELAASGDLPPLLNNGARLVERFNARRRAGDPRVDRRVLDSGRTHRHEDADHRDP